MFPREVGQVMGLVGRGFQLLDRGNNTLARLPTPWARADHDVARYGAVAQQRGYQGDYYGAARQDFQDYRDQGMRVNLPPVGRGGYGGRGGGYGYAQQGGMEGYGAPQSFGAPRGANPRDLIIGQDGSAYRVERPSWIERQFGVEPQIVPFAPPGTFVPPQQQRAGYVPPPQVPARDQQVALAAFGQLQQPQQQAVVQSLEQSGLLPPGAARQGVGPAQLGQALSAALHRNGYDTAPGGRLEREGAPAAFARVIEAESARPREQAAQPPRAAAPRPAPPQPDPQVMRFQQLSVLLDNHLQADAQGTLTRDGWQRPIDGDRGPRTNDLARLIAQERGLPATASLADVNSNLEALARARGIALPAVGERNVTPAPAPRASVEDWRQQVAGAQTEARAVSSEVARALSDDQRSALGAALSADATPDQIAALPEAARPHAQAFQTALQRAQQADEALRGLAQDDPNHRVQADAQARARAEAAIASARTHNTTAGREPDAGLRSTTIAEHPGYAAAAAAAPQPPQRGASLLPEDVRSQVASLSLHTEIALTGFGRSEGERQHSPAARNPNDGMGVG